MFFVGELFRRRHFLYIVIDLLELFSLETKNICNKLPYGFYSYCVPVLQFLIPIEDIDLRVFSYKTLMIFTCDNGKFWIPDDREELVVAVNFLAGSGPRDIRMIVIVLSEVWFMFAEICNQS